MILEVINPRMLPFTINRMNKNILLLETIAPEAMDILRKASGIKILMALDYEALREHCASLPIHAIITRGKGEVRKALMEPLNDLEVIARCGVGLDNIDVNEATSRGIKVVNAPNSNADTIAEHTIALLLMLQRNLYNAISMVKENRWGDRSSYSADESNGKTLGIIGMGNIGKKVAKIAAALGMKVIYWSAKEERVPYPFVDFDTLLRTSDSISLHLPLTPETEQLVGASEFSKMKTSALLINTARGGIIDQEALHNALENKEIAGFAADVLAKEPPADHDPLVQMDNVLVTAHLGSLTRTTYTKMCTMTVENTLAILRNEPPMKNCIFNRNELN